MHHRLRQFSTTCAMLCRVSAAVHPSYIISLRHSTCRFEASACQQDCGKGNLGSTMSFVRTALVLQGVQLNAVDGAGNTALMDAIRHSHKEVQAALRAAGANLAAVNVADKLCLAAAEDDTPFLEVRSPPGCHHMNCLPPCPVSFLVELITCQLLPCLLVLWTVPQRLACLPAPGLILLACLLACLLVSRIVTIALKSQTAFLHMLYSKSAMPAFCEVGR